MALVPRAGRRTGRAESPVGDEEVLRSAKIKRRGHVPGLGH
jgi:hypothetical protein